MHEQTLLVEEPKSAKGQKQKPPASFDYLVGACKQGGWHFEAERLGNLEVDDQFELGGLLDRQVGGLYALEDLIDEAGGTVVEIRIVHAVAQQPAQLHELARRVR